MKNFMLFLMTLFLSCHVMAQQTTVTGTITDGTDGSPLIGANVLVKGTGTGSIADVNGKFSVSVPTGKDVLVISCIGYKQQEITLKAGQKVVNVVMKEDSELLDEVVVVGYGTMKKSDLSGASVSMGEDAIKGSIITNLDQSLQGRAACDGGADFGCAGLFFFYSRARAGHYQCQCRTAVCSRWCDSAGWWTKRW